MGLLEELAEKRIRNAMSEGAFDELPGRGRRPVHLDGAYDDHVRRRLGGERNQA